MTCSTTSRTWIFDFLTTAMTDITGHLTAHHSKRSLRIYIDNPGTMTASTGYRTSPWLSSRTVTGMTACFTMVLNFFFSTKNRFFKLEINAVLEVIPLTRCIWITACTTTKEAREDIFKATKTSTIKATKTTCSATEATISPRSTILVISSPFLLVTQSLISFLNFLVLFLSTRLLVDIWVIFFR